MRRVFAMALAALALLCAKQAQADPFTVVLANVHGVAGDTIWLGNVSDSDLVFGHALIVVGRHKSEVSDSIITLTAGGPSNGVFESASNAWRSANASDFLGGLTSGAIFSHGHGSGGALSNGASAEGASASGKAGSDGSNGNGGSSANASGANGTENRSSVGLLAATGTAGTGVLAGSSAPLATNPEPSPLLLAASGLVVFLLSKRLRSRPAL